jgi:hypothetical protein
VKTGGKGRTAKASGVTTTRMTMTAKRWGDNRVYWGAEGGGPNNNQWRDITRMMMTAKRGGDD